MSAIVAVAQTLPVYDTQTVVGAVRDALRGRGTPFATEEAFGPAWPFIRRLIHRARSAGVEMILPSAILADMLLTVVSSQTPLSNCTPG